MDESPFHLEVCVDRIDDALRALDAGATRIELNSGLGLDGLTPSPAACRWLRGRSSAPIIAMLRPHASGFQYSVGEQECLLSDCQALLDAGVDGVAFGAVTASNALDLDLIARVRELCVERQLVLHRVFDVLKDPWGALEQARQLGVDRVLSSGQRPTALAGLELLADLQADAGRIEFLPGSGINSSNAEAIVQAMRRRDPDWPVQVHGSFRGDAAGPSAKDIQQTREILEGFVGFSA